MVRLWTIFATIWILATGILLGQNLCLSWHDTSAHAPLQEPIALAKLVGSPFDFVAVIDCFPDNENTTINWTARLSALAFILAPPLGLLLLGFALSWAMAGFRTRG